MSEDRKRLGKQLSDLRRDRGWTLADLSRRVGRQPTRLSEIENGKANCTVDSLVEIGSAMRMRLAFVPEKQMSEVMALIGHKSDSEIPYAPHSTVYDDVFVPDPEDGVGDS